MQKHIMSDRKALTLIRPRSSKDRRSLRNLAGYVLVAVTCVTALVYWQGKAQERRVRDWVSATAKIEDARPKLVSQGNSDGGGAMLYQVEILARYTQSGVDRSAWISVAQYPMLRAEAELKADRWKGHTCIVRWRASEPNNLIAEAS